MSLSKCTLPATDDELIHELGLDDLCADDNQEINVDSWTSSNGFENAQSYQQTVSNTLGFHQPARTISYNGICPTGINLPHQGLDMPWNSHANLNNESPMPGYNTTNRDGYFGSNINMLVEDLINDLDHSDGMLQDGYSGSNGNKLVDDYSIDHDLNCYMQTFTEVPASTSRFEGMQDNQQMMDDYLMVYQPTEIISYVDMSEARFEDSLY